LISDTICTFELVVIGAEVGVIVVGGGVKTTMDWLLVMVVGGGVLTTGGLGVEVTGGGVILVSGGPSVVA